MRPIKFRAWYQPTSYDGVPTIPRMIHFDEMGYCDEYNHLTFQLRESDRSSDGGDYSNLGADVDSFLSVMQFTGLLDKNGKEIYEGDLLKRDIWKVPMSVEWNAQYCCFEVVRDDLVFLLRESMAKITYVVGNVHENPELAK